MTESPPCRVSVVVTTRNDDFGADMLERLRACAENLLFLANRHGLDGELIVVEWNPPPGPRLHESLELGEKSDRFALRFIEVPPEVHAGLRHHETIPLFQMIAKNFGIRRARGDWVIATNQDILFSEDLVRFLASDEPDPGAMYRVDRRDVPADLPLDLSVPDRLAWCKRNVLRVHHRDLSRRTALGRALLPEERLPLWKQPPLRVLAGLLTLAGGVLAGLATRVRGGIHTNGCGDFTMLTRARWEQLRGYPEFELFSMHLDSLLCWQAHAAGARQVILRGDRRAYHIEHGHSWANMDIGEKMRTFERKPWIDLGLYSDLVQESCLGRVLEPFNPPSWGGGDAKLPETWILGGDRGAGPASAA